MQAATATRLDRPVDPGRDHVLGLPAAGITLVEYGSYACPYCRAANEHIAEARDALGDRLRYVFRHKPLTGSDIARRAAELVERAPDAGGVLAGARHADDALGDADRGRPRRGRGRPRPRRRRGGAAPRPGPRVAADERSARASGVLITPTFFINGRRYDGAWDESSFGDAMLGTLGHRVRAAALDFAGWAPSAGLLLLLATRARDRCSPTRRSAPASPRFWQHEAGIVLGGAELPAVAAALGQRRAADGVLPGGRARDQARVHRRPPRQRRAPRRCRSPRRSAACWRRR